MLKKGTLVKVLIKRSRIHHAGTFTIKEEYGNGVIASDEIEYNEPSWGGMRARTCYKVFLFKDRTIREYRVDRIEEIKKEEKARC